MVVILPAADGDECVVEVRQTGFGPDLAALVGPDRPRRIN
jgi:hypothetical protein